MIYFHEMRVNRKSTLFCFSPPVMIATLTTESFLAFYTLWRYKLSLITKLAAIMLFTLAIFQLAEYYVCTGYGLPAEQWSRLGFVAITALPALGIHILYKLNNKSSFSAPVIVSYALMTGYMAIFLSYKTAFIGYQCTGNYVIFQLGPTIGGFYSLYYFGLLAFGIGRGLFWANKLKNADSSLRNRLQAIRGLIIGYLVFLVPTALSLTFQPQTRQGIPSIMCGFAVLFAFVLSLYILPKVAEVTKEHSLSS